MKTQIVTDWDPAVLWFYDIHVYVRYMYAYMHNELILIFNYMTFYIHVV